MQLKDAMRGRKSVRAYTQEKVSKETLYEVLTLATRAISGENLQPWEFVVVTGDALDAIREDNIACFRNKVLEDRPFSEVPGGIYKERSRTIGKALLSKMNIAREDKEGRQWWWERGYRFFDAPVGIYILMDRGFEETAYRFDIGCVTQNLCLAAYEYGLGTCVADQVIAYQKKARELLNIPDNKYFVAGIALGYPDMEFPANQVVSEREDVNNLTSWHGFE